MRRALLTASSKPMGAFLGPRSGEVPRTTARALESRGLAVVDGSRLKLTEHGETAAAEVAEAHRRLLHGDD
jgi:Mn-dependent DtxR family transcriptional regulator